MEREGSISPSLNTISFYRIKPFIMESEVIPKAVPVSIGSRKSKWVAHIVMYRADWQNLP